MLARNTFYGCILLATAVATLAAGDTSACVNVTYTEAERVRFGFDELSASEPNKAALQAGGGTLRDPPSAKPIGLAAQQVVAVAIARNNGVLNMDGFHGSKKESLAWAVRTLRFVVERHGDDPVARSQLAEALERTPEQREEAHAILSELAEEDLLGSGEGYAALARLKVARGDKAGAESALTRCRIMTKKPSEVCTAPGSK